MIRFLYGRPLETLLATWGISLVLIQTVRLIFGAQNVAVANPDWLVGRLRDRCTASCCPTAASRSIVLRHRWWSAVVWFILQRRASACRCAR